MRHFLPLLTIILLAGCKGHLIFIGDSHTAGMCLDDRCTPFVEVAERNLRGVYDVSALGFYGHPMFKFGFNEEFFAENVAPHVSGATVHVMLGTNDTVYGFPVEWVWAATNRVIDNLRNAGATRVVLSPPPPMFDPEPPLLAAYRDEILEICEGRPDAECGPDPWEFLGERHFVDPDGEIRVHMNQAGHRRLGDSVSWFWLLQAAEP